MADTTRTAPYSRGDQARGFFGTTSLRASLALGSVLDLGVGTWMMFRPEAFLALTAVPPELYDAMAFWVRYVAVFLFVLPPFYMLPVLDPGYVGNVKGAVFGRSLGFMFYLMYCIFGGAHWAFLGVGVVNLALALHYAIALAHLK